MLFRWLLTTYRFLYRTVHTWNFGRKGQVYAEYRIGIVTYTQLQVLLYILTEVFGISFIARPFAHSSCTHFFFLPVRRLLLTLMRFCCCMSKNCCLPMFLFSQRGKYEIPAWLSQGSILLIGQMLQVRPSYIFFTISVFLVFFPVWTFLRNNNIHFLKQHRSASCQHIIILCIYFDEKPLDQTNLKKKIKLSHTLFITQLHTIERFRQTLSSDFTN